MASSSKRMVTLRSSDGMTREVEESAAARSSIIRDMIRDVPSGKIIDIPNVSGEILYIVLDYCVAAPLVPLEEVQAWKSRLSQLDESTLRDLDKAAQFLDLGSLRDSIFQTLEDRRTQAASRLSDSPAPSIPQGFLQYSSSLHSTMPTSSTGMVNLQSWDGKILEVEESVAVRSPTIRDDPSGETFDVEAWRSRLSQYEESSLHILYGAATYACYDDVKDLASQALNDRTQAASRLPIGLSNSPAPSTLPFSLSSTMSTSSTRMVTLESSDGEIIEVEESVAVMSRTIKDMIEDNCADKIIEIPQVSGKIINKVIDYCRRKHSESTAAASLVDEKEIKPWEYEFLQVDKSTLQGLSEASVILNIDSLMELTFQTLKDMATGIAEQEVLKKTRTEKYYTKEEEEERRKRYCIPNGPLKLSLGRDSTKEKDFSIPNDPPKERDLGKESPEYTKEEETEPWNQCSIGRTPWWRWIF